MGCLMIRPRIVLVEGVQKTVLTSLSDLLIAGRTPFVLLEAREMHRWI